MGLRNHSLFSAKSVTIRGSDIFFLLCILQKQISNPNTSDNFNFRTELLLDRIIRDITFKRI